MLEYIIGAAGQGAHIVVCGALASAAWVGKRRIIAVFILSCVVLKAEARSAYASALPPDLQHANSS